jgi:hypothetical protein
MFPNVRLLIAAVVASVVALSCGFAVFAVFRVNHEPLSRLPAGAAPLQLAVGNPMPSVAIPAPADSFGNRFPLNNGDAAGASAQVAPPQPERDDSVEAPSAVATTATITTTAPETEPAESAQPAPVAQAPAAEPVAQIPEPRVKPNEVATTTPSEPPPAAPIEAPQATTDTAATEPPPEQALPAAQTAPTEQASQESNPPTETATTPTAEPPPPEAPRKAAHRHRLAAKAQRARQARVIVPTVSQPAGIGGPFVPPPSRLVARPQRPRHARATVQPVSQPSGVGGPFVPPANR